MIVLVRHGQTEWSASGRHTSVSDIPLTDTGRQAAQKVGGRLRGRDFALVLASPRQRAQETARRAGQTPQIDPDLAEFDYGEYEGKTTKEIRATRPDWFLWRDGAPNGETADEVGARVDRVLARAREADGDVALFAHGHVLRVVGARWIGLDAEWAGSLALDTASVSELGYEREARVLWLWNDTSHLVP
jgi:probable phosphoglycerate mutase